MLPFASKPRMNSPEVQLAVLGLWDVLKDQLLGIDPVEQERHYRATKKAQSATDAYNAAAELHNIIVDDGPWGASRAFMPSVWGGDDQASHVAVWSWLRCLEGTSETVDLLFDPSLMVLEE